jgi:hypothetical protein
MANTYTWNIVALDCLPSAQGQTNVVSNVHWVISGTDETNNASVYGSQPLTYTAGSPFTAYSGLTESIVLGWLQSAMGAEQVTAIQANLDNQISNLANPPIITPPLPWTSA